MIKTIYIIVFILAFFVVILYAINYLRNPSKKNSASPLSSQTSQMNQSKYYIALDQKSAAKLKQIIQTNSEAKNLYQQMQSQANKALNQTPNPISEIQSSKVLKGEAVKTQSLQSVKDADKVYALGFAYAVSGDAKYADKIQEFMLAWAKTNKPSGDPINTRLLEPMYMGYDIVRDTFDGEDKNIVDTWLNNSAQTLIDAINPKGTAARNNHNSHLLNVVTMVAFTAGDQKLIDYAVSGYKRQIEVDLNPDGSSFDFHQRDALYYHVFTLEPLLNIARIGQLNGFDLFHYESPTGSSLQKSIDFLMPYATGEKTHEEWVNSTAPFDKERAKAGLAEFQPGVLFQPDQAYESLELYYYFNQDILPLVLKLSGSDAKKYPDFTLVYIDSLL
ncbi:hypothetical protein A2866_05865 [Candidatus Roizmanbacteria bacterium RIFCSPHIGHO2_01_FULL_39_8]|uniref:Alginate lyase domain-containing protein n=2 Tax=Candidatus Roizmaniibacteriota TaxID=1752723 RepID=A0A1F7GT96_9BACT|nr:MAG: hypothetical protein A2866_05865 [Candidatus Roizmanbacteria bacterium RIFCSPHIGHO2_01_FULL_39_8]OGK27225.1 MAG: hypothetical protein A3C28_04280 [Candidatus Roizmanbacteria bacterium RIFCSPHIGHO2_02_FULL_39_9]